MMVDLLFSATPILLTLGLLAFGGTRMPGWIPPAAGTLAAAAIALWWFNTETQTLLATGAESFWTLIKVLAIIGGGVLLSRVMDRTGAQQKLAGWLAQSGPSVATGLLMSHGVVPFFETATGFGVALIIGLPLLLSFGFTPFRAAMLTLMGLMIGPWGSMAPGTLLGSQIGGVSLTDLGIASGVVSIVSMIISGVVAAIVAGTQSFDDRRDPNASGLATVGAKNYLRWGAIGAVSGLVLVSLIIGANILLGTPVAGATATLITTLGWLLIIRRGKLTPGPGRSLLPYLLLVAGTITGQLLSQGVRAAAGDNFTWLAEVLASPALWSVTAAVTGLLILPIESEKLRRLPAEAGIMWAQTAIPTGLYIVLGVAMSGGGLATVLAESFTRLGGAYLFLIPFLGGLSGYITASGTGGNAMFGATQTAAAHSLGVSPLWTMAVQNTAACWAIIASPARVELAYRLAIPAQNNTAVPGPRLTRASLYQRTVPIVLICLVIWGIGCVILLPLTDAVSF